MGPPRAVIDAVGPRPAGGARGAGRRDHQPQLPRALRRGRGGAAVRQSDRARWASTAPPSSGHAGCSQARHRAGRARSSPEHSCLVTAFVPGVPLDAAGVRSRAMVEVARALRAFHEPALAADGFDGPRSLASTGAGARRGVPAPDALDAAQRGRADRRCADGCPSTRRALPRRPAGRQPARRWRTRLAGRLGVRGMGDRYFDLGQPVDQQRLRSTTTTARCWPPTGTSRAPTGASRRCG